MILVTGGTGFVGSAIVRHLVELGHSVRVLARHPEEARPTLPAGIERVKGDVLDPDSLAAAMAGVRAVIHCVGIIAETRAVSFEDIHDKGTANVVAAAKQAGVRRFVLISAQGTRATARSRYHLSKQAGEVHVRRSQLAFTILRPSIIYGKGDHLVTLVARLLQWPLDLINLYTLPLPDFGRRRIQPVPVEEVALCAVRSLTRPQAVGKILAVVGPEPLRWREFFQLIATVLGVRSCFEPYPFLTALRVLLWTLVLGLPILIPLALFAGVEIPAALLATSCWLLLVEIARCWTTYIFFGVPLALIRPFAWLADHTLPRSLRFSEQLKMLEEDNEGDWHSTSRLFGYTPRPLAEGLRRVLLRPDSRDPH